MSIKTENDRLLQPSAENEALRPESNAPEQAGSTLDSRASSLPKVSETDRHLALWEKQIKDTEKQIQNIEDGKKDRGVYSWLVGTDAADDKALASAKSHLEELQKSAKELRETGNLDKSKSDFKRLAGERGEQLDQSAEDYEKVVLESESAAQTVRAVGVTSAAIAITGGSGVVAGVVAAVAGGLSYDAVDANFESSNTTEALEKFVEKATTHVGEDALSGVIAGGTTLASLKFAGSLAPKIQGIRALGVFGEYGSQVAAHGIIGSTAGAVGAGANTGITTEIARQRAISEHASSGSTQPLEEFLKERGLTRVDQLKGLGESVLGGAGGGLVGGKGAFIREGIKSAIGRAGVKTAELGLAATVGLGVSALDGEITASDLVSEGGSALFGDILGEMASNRVSHSEAQESGKPENKTFNRMEGTDVGGIATAHPEYNAFVERARAEGFAVRLDPTKRTSAHVDTKAKEVVIGSETSWTTLQHESAHLDLYRSVQENAGGDLVDSASARNYSEIDSLDSSDPLLANALRVAKGAGLSDKATHETVAVMRELETLRSAGVPETDLRYRQTMDYALAHWEVELAKIPEGQRTPEQQTALEVTQDSRKSLGLSKEQQKESNARAEDNFSDKGVYLKREEGNILAPEQEHAVRDFSRNWLETAYDQGIEATGVTLESEMFSYDGVSIQTRLAELTGSTVTHQGNRFTPEYRESMNIFMNELVNFVETRGELSGEHPRLLEFMLRVNEAGFSRSPNVAEGIGFSDQLILAARANSYPEIQRTIGHVLTGEFTYNLAFADGFTPNYLLGRLSNHS